MNLRVVKMILGDLKRGFIGIHPEFIGCLIGF